MDFAGNKLHVGDKVVVAINHGRNSGASLTFGVIAKITPKMVSVTQTEYYNSYKRESLLKTDKSKVLVLCEECAKMKGN